MASRHGAVSRLVLVVAVTASLGACHLGQPSVQTENWSYHGETGPAFWPQLFPVDCSYDGQSPVDLAQATTATLAPISFRYGIALSMRVENNGHSIKAKVPQGVASLTIGTDPTVWRLDEFHFHGRSEHRIGARDYPLELHLVHYEPAGKPLAVGIFLNPGPANEQLSKIWDRLPGLGSDPIEVKDFDLAQLLPQTLHSYRYYGSLTTPDCGQGVRWNVLAQPMTMTAEQLEAFHEIFSGPLFPEGNRRPIQPFNGRRPLETDVPSN